MIDKSQLQMNNLTHEWKNSAPKKEVLQRKEAAKLINKRFKDFNHASTSFNDATNDGHSLHNAQTTSRLFEQAGITNSEANRKTAHRVQNTAHALPFTLCDPKTVTKQKQEQEETSETVDNLFPHVRTLTPRERFALTNILFAVEDNLDFVTTA